MKRLIVPIGLGLLLAGMVVLLASHPGRASADWLGWRVDTSAALVAVLGVVVSLLLAGTWTAFAWLVHAPGRAAAGKNERRRRQANEALSRAALALAAGAPDEAQRGALEAIALEGSAHGRLLAAQAAEALGDDAAAQASYAAMLDMPEARAAAREGLARLDARRAEPPAPAREQPAPALEAPLSLGG